MTEDEADAFYLTVGRRVADLRVDCGLTQSDVATACGLTRSSIANLEAGRQRVPAHVLATIAGLFDVRLADLLDGADSLAGASPMTLGVIRDQAREIARLRAVLRSVRTALVDASVGDGS